jgi:glyoxylase I family protein
MVTKMHHLALEVSDIERSTRFYTELLGFTKTGEYYFEDRGRHIVFLDLDGVCLELLSGPTNTPHEPRPAEQCAYKHLALVTDDVDGDIEKLRAAGVPLKQEPGDTAMNSRMAFVEDPDGLPVELWQNL